MKHLKLVISVFIMMLCMPVIQSKAIFIKQWDGDLDTNLVNDPLTIAVKQLDHHETYKIEWIFGDSSASETINNEIMYIVEYTPTHSGTFTINVYNGGNELILTKDYVITGTADPIALTPVTITPDQILLGAAIAVILLFGVLIIIFKKIR